MAKSFLILFFSFFAIQIFSQTNPAIEIDNVNNLTIDTCSVDFVDSGGFDYHCWGQPPTGNYSPNEDYTVTFCSNDPANPHIQIYFANTDIHYTDTLYIYDGPDVNSPLIGAYNCCTPEILYLTAIEASLTNTSGCLTINFVSNGVSQSSGWLATIQCVPVCQEIIAHLDPVLTTPTPDTSYIAICPGEPITFSGYADYPENDYVYHQSNSTSVFTWYFGDGQQAVGQTVTHNYANIGGYTVTLIVTDINNCENINSIETRVVIAGNPFAEIIIPTQICANDTANLIFSSSSANGTVIGDPFNFDITTTLGVSDTTYLPDGTGACYETSVIFNCFAPGQTLENPQDVLSVCAVMEHSWLGDVEISLICPNGQSLILKEYPGGGGCHLGEPLNYNPSPAGIGYNYCWTPITPTYGTMVSESASYSTLPAGSYTPYGTFADLVGCPLNGEWTIQVCDNWAIDDGYIFSWEISLNPLIAPATWSYVVPIDNQAWTNGPYIVSQNDTSALVVAPIAGNYQYTYSIVDHYGCNWDTTVTLNVIQSPVINLGADKVICDGNSSTLLDVGSVADSYLWSNGSTTQTIQVSQNGEYYVTATIGLCDAVDTISVFYHTGFQYNNSYENVKCFDESNGSITVIASSDYPPSEYIWSNGEITNSVSGLLAGNYIVTVTDLLGCTDVQSFEISQPTQLIASNNFLPVLCYGGNEGSIDVSVSGGVAPYSYLWNNNSTNEDLINIYAGNYVVTITDFNSCKVIQNVNIIEPNEIIISLPDNLTVCKQSNNILTPSIIGGTLPYTYIWNNGETTESINYSINNQTNYSITVTDNHNCTAQQNTTILTYSNVTTILEINDDTVCSGNAVNVSANITGGLQPYIIYLNNNIITLPLNIYPNGQDDYVLNVVDGCGYSSVNNFELNTYPEVVVSFSANVLYGCMPLSVNFNISNYQNGFQTNWNFGDNTTSNSQNPNHVFENSGLFGVSLEVLDKNNCRTELIIDNLINVYPNPEAHFLANPQIVSIINPQIDFINLSNNANSYLWSFGDGDSSKIVNPTHNYSEINTYIVKLLAITEKGCLDSAYQTIEIVEEPTFYVPSAFSPDGDNINDFFEIKANSIDLDNFTVKIYDRWGEIIFESTDLYKSWDGKTKNKANFVEIGSYVWLVNFKDVNGVEYQKSGTVTVIR